MATDRASIAGVVAAAVLMLWPAIWNGYPIVFADTGTYLSQAIHHYAGWDRPVFYSLFMLSLHWMVTVWPVVVVQALLAAWVMWLVCRVLLPGMSSVVFVCGVGALSVFSWLPWIVSELMPDLFTPLLILLLCLLGWVPDRLARWEQIGLVGLSAFMIATQQSSLPLACLLIGVRLALGWRLGIGGAAPSNEFSDRTDHIDGFLRRRNNEGRGQGSDVGDFDGVASEVASSGARGALCVRRPPRARWSLLILPPALAVLGLCTVNLAAHGRFVVSPFGNVFLLARVIYDGPGMAALRRDCAAERWLLCPFLNEFPPTSDDFLWTANSPLNRAGGPKVVSAEAGAIIRAALLMDPAGEARAAAHNALEQLRRFDSGDGLTPWPEQVSGWIERDFSVREFATYGSAAQQRGVLSVPGVLVRIHNVIGLAGVVGCAILLPVAFRRRADCTGFLLFVLLALPISAAITGALSAPHERYQSRIMWLAPFVAVLSLANIRYSRWAPCHADLIQNIDRPASNGQPDRETGANSATASSRPRPA